MFENFLKQYTRASMTALWKAISTTDADGGLKSCLTHAEVHLKLQEHLTSEVNEGCGFKTLRDFATSFTEEDHVTELDLIWKAQEETKKMRAHRGRLISAWLAAHNAIKSLEAATPGGAGGNTHASEQIDWEAPLDERDIEDMQKAWNTKYSLPIEAHVLPGQPLESRIFREFRRFALTVTRIEKMKSVLHERQPDKIVETAVTSRCKMVENLGTSFSPASVTDYYFGLRTLGNAWGRAGNYEVDSAVEKLTRVLMMPMHIGLDYADRCLRMTTTSGLPMDEQLDWLRRKDFLTRTLMANLIREKWPAGEALKKAITESAHDWTIVRNAEVIGPHESILTAAYKTDNPDISAPLPHTRGGVSLRPRSRSRGNGKGKGKEKHYAVGSLRILGPSGKLCGAFNGRRGCTSSSAKKCPQKGKHCCGYIVSEYGDICGATDHGAAGHR